MNCRMNDKGGAAHLRDVYIGTLNPRQIRLGLGFHIINGLGLLSVAEIVNPIRRRVYGPINPNSQGIGLIKSEIQRGIGVRCGTP